MHHQLLHTKKFKVVMGVLVGLVLILVAFRAGMHFGFRQATFTMHWNDNYERNFFGNKKMMKTHGTIGTILKIDGSVFVVAERDGEEESVVASSTTLFKKAGGDSSYKELKVNDKVAVIGVPNDAGQIEAKLIRLLQ